MRGRILYFRCKSNRFVSISKCRLRADRVAMPRKGPKHGDFCVKMGDFGRRSWRFSVKNCEGYWAIRPVEADFPRCFICCTAALSV